MNLLISAYACAPNRGSEHGSAWNWTSEAGAARPRRDGAGVAGPSDGDPRGGGARPIPEKDPLAVPGSSRPGRCDKARNPAWERTYNLLWQRQALRIARALHREQPFDLVHHLTWGGRARPDISRSARRSDDLRPGRRRGNHPRQTT